MSPVGVDKSRVHPGVIEAVKRGIIRALRSTFEENFPNPILSNVNVDMEYPATKETYPGIWVQFSLTTIQRAGIAQEIYDPDSNSYYYHWRYAGTVTLTIVALTSKERDQMSDGLINLFAFGRYIDGYQTFTAELKSYPYVAIAIDQDALTPGGQSVNVGVPWDPDQLAYEDSYSFNVMGEFYMNTDPKDEVLLSSLDVLGTQVIADDNPDGLGRWV